MMKFVRLFLLIGIILSISIVACAEADLENSWICPVCGASNNDNFCPKDGTPRPEETWSDFEDNIYEDNIGNDGESEGAPQNEADGIRLPVFSELFSGTPIRLHLLPDKNDRAYSKTGPGNYLTAGGYKPHQQQEMTAYFMDHGWIYVFMDYQTEEDRCVYFRKSDFETPIPELPDISNIETWEGTVLSDTLPCWGPSSQFNLLSVFPVKEGTQIRAFFQENGYVYAEFEAINTLTEKSDTARLWLPADSVSIPGVFIEGSKESSVSQNVSDYGRLIIVDTPTEEQQEAEESEGALPVAQDSVINSEEESKPVNEAPESEDAQNAAQDSKINSEESKPASEASEPLVNEATDPSVNQKNESNDDDDWSDWF